MKKEHLIIKVEKLRELHTLTLEDNKGILELNLSKVRRGLINLLTIAMESESFDAYRTDISNSVCDIEGLLFMIDDIEKD